MVGARNSVHHRHGLLLVAAELPQHIVDGILLHVHVEQQRRPRHPVLLVPEAQSREALWCAGRDSLLRVWHPPDVRILESVELPDEVLVRPLRRGRTRSAYKPNVNHKCRLNKLDEMERQIESER
jgi:hypothetical protein